MKLTKNWYQSKTIVASISLLVMLLNRYFGFVVIEDSEVFNLLSLITEVALSVMVIYGRTTATKGIK